MFVFITENIYCCTVFITEMSIDVSSSMKQFLTTLNKIIYSRAMYFEELFQILGVQRRSKKPREVGLTIVLDKLTPIDKNFLKEVSGFVDVVKIGWTLGAIVSKEYLRRRVELYKELDIMVSSGGTLLELAYSQGNVLRLFEILRELGFDIVEVSNGILNLSRTEKTTLIKKARLRGFKVIAEVGKKNPSYRMSIHDAVREAQNDLEDGAWKVIIEGRELGRATCIFDETGNIIWERVNIFLKELELRDIVFEAPLHEQQVELILNLGPNVNLANISFDDVISLETLRLGIRGDTYLLGRERPLNVSPSARFVYFVLKEKGPLTVREIQKLTGLSRRTIHNSLKELKDIYAVKDFGSKGREKIWAIT